MKEVLLVKHAVGGRTFIHSGQSSAAYSVTRNGDNWTIAVQITPDVDIQELLHWKDELNVFVFQEFEDQPTIKIWFYVKDGPVTYDEQLRQLTIHAESRIDYVPSEFGI
ncbi:MAG: hypothetical protein WDZ91_04415 [Paenibacillaceae bacterium]